MKISIITAAKNNKAGLIRAIESVRSQTYKNVEHIIVDGGSTDGTIEILKQVQNDIPGSKLPTTHYSLLTISEADTGIYDAINKGIKLATGDVIGLLHSDDFYVDEFVLEKIATAFGQSIERNDPSSLDSARDDTELRVKEAFSQSAVRQALSPFDFAQDDKVEAVYSDLVYVRKKSKVRSQKSKNVHIDNSELKIEHSVIRYWKAHKIKKTSFATPYSLLPTTHLLNGWMPPHPTLFIRKEIFEKYGLYKTDMKISADYEMILRLFYKHKITTLYLPITTYCMTIGGASNKSLKNIFIKSSEDYKSMKMHRIPFPLYTLLCKNVSKLPQFLGNNK